MKNALPTVLRPSEMVLEHHRVLRNTYALLSLTLLFSAATALFATATQARPLGLIITLIGTYGLLFLTQALRNSGWGILSMFAFTGFLGYTVGPLLNMILGNFANGSQIITLALGATGVIFLSLSAYTVIQRKNFSYLGGFLVGGCIAGLGLMIAGIFFQTPLLFVVISGVFALLSSGMIMYHTSAIIHGGETNYIMATLSIFVALYNLFVSLLNLFSFFSNRE